MSRRMGCGQDRAFLGISALLFSASAAVTIVWCASMSAMTGMPMPGGWTMSMAWMRMPDQTWLDVGVSFLGMWIVMMAAMMLPSLVPILWRYRQAVVDLDEGRRDWMTASVGAAYFVVWSAFGIVAFSLGAAIAAIVMEVPSLSRAVPIAVAVIVVLAGALQFTTWKAHHLACCQPVRGRVAVLRAEGNTAWRYGLRLGMHCVKCCSGLTAILLVVGVMDVRAMALVATGITIERLVPAAERVARVIGIIVVAAGMFLVARAIGVSGIV